MLLPMYLALMDPCNRQMTFSTCHEDENSWRSLCCVVLAWTSNGLVLLCRVEVSCRINWVLAIHTEIYTGIIKISNGKQKYFLLRNECIWNYHEDNGLKDIECRIYFAFIQKQILDKRFWRTKCWGTWFNENYRWIGGFCNSVMRAFCQLE